MAGLLDLPQQIDAAINGIVSFGYRTTSTWFRATANPLFGPLRLLTSKKSITSGTLLFIACAAFVTSGGGTNLILPAEAAAGAGLDKVGAYLLGVVLCFLIADAAAHLLSAMTTPAGRKRRRAVELLRYALAAAIMNIAIASIVIDVINRVPEGGIGERLGPSQAPQDLRISENLTTLALVIPLLGVAAMSFFLLANRHALHVGSRVARSVSTLILITVLWASIFGVRVTLVPSPPRDTAGWEESEYLYCKNLGDGVIEARAIFYNGHGHQIVLGRDDWLLTAVSPSGPDLKLSTVDAIEPAFVKIQKHSEADVLLRFRAAADQIPQLERAQTCRLKLSRSPDDLVIIDALDEPYPGVDGRIIQGGKAK